MKFANIKLIGGKGASRHKAIVLDLIYEKTADKELTVKYTGRARQNHLKWRHADQSFIFIKRPSYPLWLLPAASFKAAR